MAFAVAGVFGIEVNHPSCRAAVVQQFFSGDGTGEHFGALGIRFCERLVLDCIEYEPVSCAPASGPEKTFGRVVRSQVDGVRRSRRLLQRTGYLGKHDPTIRRIEEPQPRSPPSSLLTS